MQAESKSPERRLLVCKIFKDSPSLAVLAIPILSILNVDRITEVINSCLLSIVPKPNAITIGVVYGHEVHDCIVIEALPVSLSPRRLPS